MVLWSERRRAQRVSRSCGPAKAANAQSASEGLRATHLATLG